MVSLAKEEKHEHNSNVSNKNNIEDMPSYVKRVLLFADKFAAENINTGSNCKRYFSAALFILGIVLSALLCLLLGLFGVGGVAGAGAVIEESGNIVLALFLLVIGSIFVYLANKVKLVVQILNKAISLKTENGAPVAHITVYSKIEEQYDEYILYK